MKSKKASEHTRLIGHSLPNGLLKVPLVRHTSKLGRTVRLKPVVQLERTGCGIASVAALACVSYKTAQRSAERLGIVAADPRLWSATGHVRRLLERYGLRAQSKEMPFKSWSALPARALLATKWHREGERVCWHWVVFVRERGKAVVLDSAASVKRHARTDFWRMKPKWFMAVTKSVRIARRRV
jgi:hypothetical protein